MDQPHLLLLYGVFAVPLVVFSGNCCFRIISPRHILRHFIKLEYVLINVFGHASLNDFGQISFIPETFDGLAIANKNSKNISR